MNKEWSRDSVGALNLRSTALAEKIIKKYSLHYHGADAFIQVFGKPNMREKTLFTDELVYLLGMGGEVAENATERDTCVIIFMFNLDCFRGIRVVCQ